VVQCIAVWCSVSQCVEVCCSVSQCVEECHSVLQCVVHDMISLLLYFLKTQGTAQLHRRLLRDLKWAKSFPKTGCRVCNTRCSALIHLSRTRSASFRDLTVRENV